MNFLYVVCVEVECYFVVDVDYGDVVNYLGEMFGGDVGVYGVGVGVFCWVLNVVGG